MRRTSERGKFAAIGIYFSWYGTGYFNTVYWMSGRSGEKDEDFLFEMPKRD
jgi:hypothetical protein